ncbi:hypothetical protein ACOMHN_052884 [Nucella lapillus]
MDRNSESGTTPSEGTFGHSHLPYWKAGSGHYGDTLGQEINKIVTYSIPLLLSFLDTVPVNKKEVFTIGDFGCNDGSSSMTLLCRVVEHLRQKHGDDLAIQIVYEDQEKNDFNSLFRRLCGSSSYMSRFHSVYPMATNINFYKQCVPAGSCDIIFSSMAAHWLEQLAVTFKDSVFGLSVSQQERSLLDQEADRDWTKFLLLRARELKPQGLLMVVATSPDCVLDPVPDEITPIASGTAEPETVCIDVILDLEDAWRQLNDGGIITQEEYEQCTAKLRFRNSEENQRPFVRADSVVHQSGLRLVHYDEVMAPCVYKAFWRQHYHNTADEKKKRAHFADLLVPVHRVWTQTIFQNSLSDMRTEPEKAAIMDDLYSRFHSLVREKDPESYRSESPGSRLIARKM